jgi:hypothetical protein
MQIIDLSAPIAPSPTDAAPFEQVAIHYTPHVEGAAQIQAMLCVPPHLLRNGEGWAVEEFTRLGTHSVTHVDAPWHYNSQIQGRRAATIDELPLEWFFADGVVLDMRHKADGEKVEVGDVEAALAGLGYSLKPLDVVLVRTGRDAFYGQPDYAWRGCAVTPGATRWLYERGVRVMGAATSPPWFERLHPFDGRKYRLGREATMDRTKAKLIVYRRVGTARQGDQQPWSGGTGRSGRRRSTRRRGRTPKKSFCTVQRPIPGEGLCTVQSHCTKPGKDRRRCQLKQLPCSTKRGAWARLPRPFTSAGRSPRTATEFCSWTSIRKPV